MTLYSTVSCSHHICTEDILPLGDNRGTGNLENFCWLVGITSVGITVYAAESGKESVSTSLFAIPGNN